MEIMTIECPKCKGQLHIDVNTKQCFCMYCRTEAQVKPLNGRVMNSTSLLTRGFLSLEYAEWETAKEVFEQAVNIEPENAQVYLGRLLTELKMSKEEDLAEYREDLANYVDYQKALRFADDELKKCLEEYNEAVKKRIEKRIEAAMKLADAARQLAKDARKRDEEIRKAREAELAKLWQENKFSYMIVYLIFIIIFITIIGFLVL